MKLSGFFTSPALVRDCEFNLTHMPGSPIPGSICYVPGTKIAEIVNRNINIVGVITTGDLVAEISAEKGVVISDNPQKAYYEFHNRLVESQSMVLNKERFIHPTATIASSAIIIGNVYIGERVVVGHGAVINENSVIGKNVQIEEYAVIGAKGMQNLVIENEIFDIKHAGGVRVGENSRILSHAVVQRPYHPFFTEIGSNAQISVNVIVGHGVVIGNNTYVAGNSQISGNTVIGNNVTVGPSSTISDGVTIGDNSQIKIGSVVIGNLAKDSIVSGNFALNHNQNLRNYIKMQK